MLSQDGLAQIYGAKTIFRTLASKATTFNILGFIIAYLFLSTVITVIHRLYFSPLAGIPGPKLAAASRLYEFWYQGVHQTKFPPQIKRLHQKYGPIVRISPFEISLNDSNFNIDFFMSDKKLDKDPWYYFFGFKNAIFVLLDKEKHKFRHANLASHFRGKYWTDNFPMITSEIASMISKFETSAIEHSTLNLSKAYRKTGNELLRNFLLGTDYNGQNSDSRDFGKQADISYQPLFRAAAWTRHFPWMMYINYLIPDFVFELTMPMGMYKREIERMIPSIIKNHDNSGKPSGNKALIYQMIDHDQSYRENGAIPAIEEFMEMLWGGRESLGHALSSVTYQLLKRPECQERLYDELKAAPFDLNTATYSQLQSLPYLWAVCKEGIRMQRGCRFRIPRVTKEPVQYKQYSLPTGTTVSMSPAFFHDDEEIFSDAMTFKPERWLEGDVNKLEKFWNPFGNGSRSCGGRPMAYEVIFRGTANVFSRYRLEFDGCDADYCSKEGMMEVFPQGDSTGLRKRQRVFLKTYMRPENIAARKARRMSADLFSKTWSITSRVGRESSGRLLYWNTWAETECQEQRDIESYLTGYVQPTEPKRTHDGYITDTVSVYTTVAATEVLRSTVAAVTKPGDIMPRFEALSRKTSEVVGKVVMVGMVEAQNPEEHWGNSNVMSLITWRISSYESGTFERVCDKGVGIFSVDELVENHHNRKPVCIFRAGEDEHIPLPRAPID
ncbi:hypothetical protein B7494_g4639 [Chlorociboria aeruginascens]|nr:hypothetical protein B7494_g4639 [Chlorociboria aeruginascens]